MADADPGHAADLDARAQLDAISRYCRAMTASTMPSHGRCGTAMAL